MTGHTLSEQPFALSDISRYPGFRLSLWLALSLSVLQILAVVHMGVWYWHAATMRDFFTDKAVYAYALGVNPHLAERDDLYRLIYSVLFWTQLACWLVWLVSFIRLARAACRRAAHELPGAMKQSPLSCTLQLLIRFINIRMFFLALRGMFRLKSGNANAPAPITVWLLAGLMLVSEIANTVYGGIRQAIESRQPIGKLRDDLVAGGCINLLSLVVIATFAVILLELSGKVPDAAKESVLVTDGSGGNGA